MSHPIVENANAPGRGRGRAPEPESRRRRADAEFLTPVEFLHRLGWLLVVVLAVALAANGLAQLAGS
jgi:hypothetical protein